MITTMTTPIEVPGQERITLDEYFMLLAFAARLRSTCPRMACGAVATRAGRVISTGYNGAPHSQAHCSEVGCLMLRERERDRCQRALHAEDNALRHANFQADTLYTTGQPCYRCTQTIIADHSQRGVIRIVWALEYPDTERDQLWLALANPRRSQDAHAQKLKFEHFDLDQLKVKVKDALFR